MVLYSNITIVEIDHFSNSFQQIISLSPEEQRRGQKKCIKIKSNNGRKYSNLTAGSTNYGYVAYYAKEVHTGESRIDNANGYLFYTYNGVN